MAYGLNIQGISDSAVVRQKVEQHLREVGLWEEVKDSCTVRPAGCPSGSSNVSALLAALP